MIARLLKIPIRIWHRLLAPCLPRVCRFHPSCSVYALEALDTLPLGRALGLICWRILRCQPFCKGGYDPVPQPRSRGEAGTAPAPHPPHTSKANKA